MGKAVFCCEAEFVGGPLDGESQKISLPAETFIGVTALPEAAASRFRRWLRQIFKRRGSQIRLAIYEFDDEGVDFRYRYVRTVVVTAMELSRLGRVDRNGQVAIANAMPAAR